MDIITVCLIIVIVVNLMLVLVSSTYPKDNREVDSIYIAYLFNITAITWWVSSMVLFRVSMSDYVVKNLYISATCIASSLYYFSLVFLTKEKSFKKDLLKVIVLNVCIVGLLLTTDLIISYNQDTGFVQFGSGYILYVCYTLILFVLSFWRLFSKYTHTKMGMERFQALSFFVGYSVSGAVGMTTNLLLPWFNISQYQYAGPLSTLCVAISISYAVKRFRLFNIQIAATEAFVLALWIFTILRVCLVEEHAPIFVNLIYIFLVVIVGILSIVSVKKEHIQYLNNLKLIKELEVINTKLHEMDAQKTKFVSLAAHHIASPLTSIKAYLSLLRGEYGGVFSGDDLKTVEQIMEDLVCILKDFMDVSRIEMKGIDLRSSSENIHSIVDSVTLKLKEKLSSKNLNIIKRFDTHETVYVDSDKIQTAIENILENSILYSKDSNIELSVSTTEHIVEVSIVDSGIRKFPHVQESLLSKFSEQYNQDEADIVGRGLGLYIAKKIIEAHNGSFTIYIREGKTVFTLTLPAGV